MHVWKKNIPNALTYSRILVIVAIIPTFYLKGEWGFVIPAALFAYASITDFFDGYLARAWEAQSSLGRFLDPIADKLLVATTLVLLVSAGRADALPAIAILCREILVSGLREFLAELRVALPVSTLAKYKTTLQMVAIFLLLLGDGAPEWIRAYAIGHVCIWAAALLTLVTGYAYLREAIKHV